MKKVSIGAKPVTRSRPVNPDEWVSNAGEGAAQVTEGAPGEPMKRLTIDVPLSLHTRIKTQCALQSEQMASAIRELLEQAFPM